MTIAAAVAVLLAALAIGWLWSAAPTSQNQNDVAATEADDSGAEWRAEVDLEHVSERNPGYERSRLAIVLRNSRGREIETPDTHFEVNGAPLAYIVARGNYYDRHPYYRLRDDDKFVLAADATYHLGIRLKTDPALPFARIRTPAPMLPANFRVPVRHPSNRDLVIQWTGLRQQADLLVYRTHTLLDAQGNQTVEAGGPYADDAIRRLIGPDEQVLREGRYAIPARYFAASAAGRVSALTIEINAATGGQFLYPVRKRSAITARRKIVFRVEVTEAREP
jgi:hypothetical protein